MSPDEMSAIVEGYEAALTEAVKVHTRRGAMTDNPRKSRRAWPPWHPKARLLICGTSECPYSHMDDGSHSDGWRDGAWCAWCGDKQEKADAD